MVSPIPQYFALLIINLMNHLHVLIYDGFDQNLVHSNSHKRTSQKEGERKSVDTEGKAIRRC